MQERPQDRSGGRAARALVSRWFRVGAPLAVGLGLIGLFVYLLFQFQEPEAPKPTGFDDALGLGRKAIKEKRLEKKAEETEVPPRPAAPPSGTGLARWTIDRLPEGWSPEIAAKLAKLFEEMDVTDASDPTLADRVVKARAELQAYLDSLGPEAIPTFTGILRGETDFVARRFLIHALGKLGPRSEDATWALREVYEANKDKLAARSETNHVIEAMGDLKNESSYGLLRTLADDRESTSPYDRDKCIQALGKHPQAAESLDKFHEWMQTDDDPNVRNHSAQALGNLKRSESVDHLIARYKEEPYVPVQQTILGSIGKIGDPGAVPFLTDVARTGEKEVRLTALHQLKRIGSPQALRNLRTLLDYEREEKLRTEIQTLLAQGPPAR